MRMRVGVSWAAVVFAVVMAVPALAATTITSPANNSWVKVGTDFSCTCTTSSGNNATWSVEYGGGTQFLPSNVGNAVTFRSPYGGMFQLTATCDGESDSVTVYVAEMWGLWVTAMPGEPWGQQYYAPKDASGSVYFYADVMAYPWPTPSGIVDWTGGAAGADQFERVVSAGAVGSTTVTGTVGTSSDSATVTIYTVSDVTVTGATQGQTNVYYCPISEGQYITVSASLTCGLPSGVGGLISWGGDGERIDDYTVRVPRWGAGTRTVSIHAGDYDRTLTFHVIEVADMTVTDATAGTSGNTYYARKQQNAFVTFSVTINPSVPLGDLPEDIVTWTVGGQPGGSNVAQVQVSRSQTGTTTVGVSCGCTGRSKSLVIFDPLDLVVVGAQAGAPEGTYYTKVGDGYVTVTLTMSPTIGAPSDFPSQLISWSGGDGGASVLERRVSKASATGQIVQVSCEGFEDSVTIDVVGVGWLDVSGAWPGGSSWDEFYAFKEAGQYVTVTAVVFPFVSADDLPSGFVEWSCSGGALGANALEWRVPKNATGSVSCTASCGTTSASASVTIMEVTGLTVQGADEGQPAHSYYTGIGSPMSSVTLTLGISPAIAPEDLPWGMVQWTGNVQWDWQDPLVCSVPKDVAGCTPVQAVCGDVTEGATIYVVEVTGLSVAGATQGNTPGVFYVQKGAGDVTVTATFNPDVGMANLPAGMVSWTGPGVQPGNVAIQSISTAVSGSSNVTVACGESSRSVTIIVIEVTDLTISGATEGTPLNTWYAARGDGYVTGTISVVPSVDPADMPGGVITWSGDGEQVDGLTRRISKGSSGEYTIGASCGAWSKTCTICIMEIMWLDVSGASMGRTSWDHYYASKSVGDDVTLTLWVNPAVLEGCVPDGIITWSGDVQGDGLCMRTMSRGVAGDFTATVTCGDDSRSVDLTVFEVTDLTVAGAVEGAPSVTYYAQLGGADEYVEITATLTPGVDEDDFPWDALNWTGGQSAPDTVLTRLVPMWMSGSTTVGLTCGDFHEECRIKVVAVTGLTVTGAVQGQTPGVYYAVKGAGGSVTLNAQIDPDVAGTLPPGFIEWTGGDEGADDLARSVPCGTAGQFDISVACGVSSMSVTIYVVEATALTVSGALEGTPQGTWYAAMGAGNVDVAVTLAPPVPATDLPVDFISWAGGDAGDSPLERHVSKGSSGETVVSATFGGASLGQVTIRIVEVWSLEVTGAVMGMRSWNHYYAAKSPSNVVTLTLWVSPAVAEGSLPDGIITWSGDVLGSGQLTRTMSCAATGNFSATVTCGENSQIVDLTVFEVTALTVNGAIAGSPTDSYYAQLGVMDDYVEVTASLSPSVDEDDFPWDALSWTGGQSTWESALTRVVPKWVSGSTTVGLACGSFEAERIINVVSVTGLNVSGATQGQTPGVYYVSVAYGEEVALTAQIDPSIAAGNLPVGFLEWTGGTPGASVFDRTVSRAMPGQYDVSVTCGESSVSVTIYVVGAAGTLTVTYAVPGQPTDTWYAGIDSGNVEIAVVLEPPVSATDLPSGFVSWSGGDAGDTCLDRHVAKSASGETDVSATLEGTEIGQVTIRVIEVVQLDVDGAVPGNYYWDRYYAVQSPNTDVTLTAVINPPVDASDLPDGIVTWSAGQEQDALTHTVSRGTTGVTPVSVTCGTSSEDVTVYVYAVTGLTVTGATEGTPAGTYYTAIGEAGNQEFVVVEADIAPEMDEDDFPFGALTWSGGGQDMGAWKRAVPKWVSGETTVGVVCGDFDDEVVIRVVELLSLTVTGAIEGKTPGTYYTSLNAGDVELVAETNPAIAPLDLPSFIAWSGDSEHDGLTAKVWADQSCDTVVEITCGASSKSAHIIVVEALHLDVSNATEGQTAKTYYAAAGMGDVALTLVVSPTVDTNDLPDGFIEWSGGEAGTTLLERSVSGDVPGTTDVTVSCGNWQEHVTIHVVEIVSLTVVGAEPGQTEGNYYAGIGSGDVTVTVETNPTVDSHDIPDGFILLMGGTPTEDPLSCTVPKSSAALVPVNAVCGLQWILANIYVVEVTDLQVTGAIPGNLGENWYTPIGSGEVWIEAVTDPVVSASDLPDGFITWSGGEEAWSQTWRIVSSDAAGFFDVSAACGDSEEDTTIIVIALASLTVDGAEEGQTASVYYAAIAESDDVIVTALIEPAGVDLDDLPDEIIGWSGGEPGDTVLERKVTLSEAASTDVIAACPPEPLAVTIHVVELDGFTVEGAVEGSPATNYYAGIGNAEDWVYVTAKLNPPVDTSDLPDSFVTWTGDGIDTLDPCQQKVSKEVSGTYDLGVELGTSSDSAKVWILEIESIDVEGAEEGETEGVYLADLYEEGDLDDKVTITVTLYPFVSAADLPSGVVIWEGGNEGNNDLERVVSRMEAGVFEITVTCGIDEEKLKIIVGSSIDICAAGVSEAKEETPGVFVRLNKDDDDKDDVEDRFDPVVTNEDELINATTKVGLPDGTVVTLTYGVGTIKVFGPNGLIDSGEEYDVSEVPGSLLIEGIAVGTVTLKLEADIEGETVSDTVTINVIDLDIVEPTVTESQEEDPGAAIFVNDDDDDEDETADCEQAMTASRLVADDDLRPLGIVLSPSSALSQGDLTLEVPACINVWVNSGGAWSKFVSGDAVDLEASYYYEGVTPAKEAWLILRFAPNNGQPALEDKVKLRVKARALDLDIDSDNDTPFAGPSRSAAEDRIEDVAGNPDLPGKIVVVNDGDTNSDGVPDFADATSPGVCFVPLVVELKDEVILSSAQVRFTYDASNPAAVARSGTAPWYIYTPASGCLRIWKKNGNVARDPASASSSGDYVPASTFTPSQLGFSEQNRIVTLYVEGIAPSSGIAASSILVEVDPDGQQGFCLNDAVRVTVVKVDLACDSNNDQSITDDDDACEDRYDGASWFGCVIMVNDGDVDQDGIPDFADGFDGDDNFGSDDDYTPGNMFKRLVLTVPLPVNMEKAKLRIDYSASDPTHISPPNYVPDSGKVRLWLKNGCVPRNKNAANAEIGAGDYVAPGDYTPAQLGLSAGTRSIDLAIEGVNPSDEPGDVRIVVYLDAEGIGQFTAMDAVRFTVLPRPTLIPNHDRNDSIDGNDRAKSLSGHPFYFWVNDDDDETADKGNDQPGAGRPDWQTTLWGWNTYRVDGVRDLIDFFPVRVDVQHLVLQFLPASSYDYVLCHGGGAFNALVDNPVVPGAARSHLVNQPYCERIANAKLVQITSSGYVLTPQWIEAAKDGRLCVILLEARAVTDAPLALEIRRKSDQQVMYRMEMPVKILNVQRMFRHRNLRDAAGGTKGISDFPDPNQQDQQPDYPDAETNDKHFVFVHGYNVDENDAQAAQCEVFKRMFWSGSRAKFHGITWRGDDWQMPVAEMTPHYHANVVHALNTAPALKSYLDALSLSGEVTLAAHSLGNMLASAAIAQGAPVKNYVAINGAVAIEAYNRNAPKPNPDGLRVAAWDGYACAAVTGRAEDFLFASEWYNLFTSDSTDPRGRLTWRGLFQGMGQQTTMYNFYSGGPTGTEGDEVLKNVPHDVDLVEWHWAFWKNQSYAWCGQEKLKGRLPVGIVAGSRWAGWGFNTLDQASETGVNQPLPPAEAWAIPLDQLKTKPFFKKVPAELFQSDDAQARAYALPRTDLLSPLINSNANGHMEELLAKAIPARTYAIGANPIPGTTSNNMMAMKDAWPQERDKDSRWRHSDFIDVAFVFTYEVYERVVQIGGLE